MSDSNHEIVSIIVVGRDKFSPTDGCLESLEKNTPEPHETILVLGGAPPAVRRRLTEKFGQKVKMIFNEEFLNPAQSRNIGLKACKTRLAVLMDNDVFVRPGWLPPLLECQKDTGSVMVVPIILETPRRIHTAGNRFYITQEGGKSYGHKELCFWSMIYGDSCNLTRGPTEYGELHCQLLEVEPTLRLKAFDENLQEVGECDSALTWSRAGLKMYFEPESVVFYALNYPVAAEDIRFFEWRWDMNNILKGYVHFEKKWGIDITEHGEFRNFLLAYNKKVGILPRLFPSAAAIKADQFLKRRKHE